MKEFFTREKANKGIELPLFFPDGSKSEHSLTVRGVDSDHFRKAEAHAKRKAIEISEVEKLEDREEAVREIELECIASLVAGWTFEEKFTPVNVVNFLREAPQIAIMVARFAARRSLFFQKKQESSTSGQNLKSNLKKSQVDPK